MTKMPGATLPSTFVNRFYLGMRVADARLVLGEKVDGDESINAAYVMHIQDLRELHRLIGDVLAEIDGPAGDPPSTRSQH